MCVLLFIQCTLPSVISWWKYHLKKRKRMDGFREYFNFLAFRTFWLLTKNLTAFQKQITQKFTLKNMNLVLECICISKSCFCVLWNLAAAGLLPCKPPEIVTRYLIETKIKFFWGFFFKSTYKRVSWGKILEKIK